MSKKEEINDSTVVRAPNHKKYYVTNVVGGLTDQDIRFELFNEKITNEKSTGWRYISDAMIILTPVGAKKLFLELKRNLDVWENENGKIEIDTEDIHVIDVK